MIRQLHALGQLPGFAVALAFLCLAFGGEVQDRGAALALSFSLAVSTFAASAFAFAAAAESRKWFLILGTVYCGLMVMSLFLI
jgi:hypothetical protein